MRAELWIAATYAVAVLLDQRSDGHSLEFWLGVAAGIGAVVLCVRALRSRGGIGATG